MSQVRFQCTSVKRLSRATVLSTFYRSYILRLRFSPTILQEVDIPFAVRHYLYVFGYVDRKDRPSDNCTKVKDELEESCLGRATRVADFGSHRRSRSGETDKYCEFDTRKVKRNPFLATVTVKGIYLKITFAWLALLFATLPLGVAYGQEPCNQELLRIAAPLQNHPHAYKLVAVDRCEGRYGVFVSLNENNWLTLVSFQRGVLDGTLGLDAAIEITWSQVHERPIVLVGAVLHPDARYRMDAIVSDLEATAYTWPVRRLRQIMGFDLPGSSIGLLGLIESQVQERQTIIPLMAERAADTGRYYVSWSPEYPLSKYTWSVVDARDNVIGGAEVDFSILANGFELISFAAESLTPSATYVLRIDGYLDNGTVQTATFRFVHTVKPQ